MAKIFIKDLKEYFGKEIELQAFVDNIRDLQWVQFVILRDGTGKVQMTIEKSEEKNKNLVELISKLPLESTILIKGIVMDSPKVKLNGMEIIPTHIEVTSTSMQELPINIKKKDNALRETRLDYRFLDLRREDNHLLFQAQTIFEHAAREFFINHNFMQSENARSFMKSQIAVYKFGLCVIIIKPNFRVRAFRRHFSQKYILH